jgi:hypothetical protein
VLDLFLDLLLFNVSWNETGYWIGLRMNIEIFFNGSDQFQGVMWIFDGLLN